MRCYTSHTKNDTASVEDNFQMEEAGATYKKAWKLILLLSCVKCKYLKSVAKIITIRTHFEKFTNQNTKKTSFDPFYESLHPENPKHPPYSIL